MILVMSILVCVLMLVVFFGVTIAGGKAHDRQNRENELKARAAAESKGGTAVTGAAPSAVQEERD